MNPGIVIAPLLLFAGAKLEISVGAGGDSNPFELPNDQAAARADSRPKPGAFVPVEASAEWKTPRRRMFRVGVESSLDGRFYAFVGQDDAAPKETSARDANRWTGEVSFPLVFDPFAGRTSAVGMELTAEPFAGAHRETFTSHRHGTPFIFADDDDSNPTTPNVPVDLSKRYDTNEAGIRADGDFELGRLVDVIAGGRFTSVDYVEDYDGTNELDSWDYTELRTALDGYVRPEDWTFAAGYSLRVRNYDERFPRDLAGDKVEDDDPNGLYEPQVFTYHDVTLRGGYVSDGGRATLRFRGTRRIDEFMGYQSYSEGAVSGDFRLSLGNDVELRLEPGVSVRSYDKLRVAYDPQEPLSSRRRVRVDMHLEWPALSRWTRLYIAGGLVSQTSENPLYDYVGFRAMTGVRAQWR